MKNDEKDRHVLAAAIRGQVDLIVTFNLKDFREEHISQWGIKAMHPQDYLLHLYSMKPTIIMLKLSQIAKGKHVNVEDIIVDLGKSLPKFSAKLIAEINQDPI